MTFAIIYPFTPYAISRSLHHFLFLDNIEKIQEKFRLNLNTFENILGNGAFAMLHFQYYSQTQYISNAPKGVIME